MVTGLDEQSHEYSFPTSLQKTLGTEDIEFDKNESTAVVAMGLVVWGGHCDGSQWFSLPGTGEGKPESLSPNDAGVSRVTGKGD